MNIPRLSPRTFRPHMSALVQSRPRLMLALLSMVLLAGIGGAILAAGTSTLTIALVPSGNIPENVGTATFEVRLSDSLQTGETAQVTVSTQNGTAPNAAVAPDDFTAKTETITFTAGVTVTTFTVDIIDEDVDEVNETFQVVLSNLIVAGDTTVNMPQTALPVIIQDDDSPTFESITSPGDVNEDAGNAFFTITMTPSESGSSVISPQPVVFTFVVTGTSPGADPATDLVVASGTWVIPGNTPVGPVQFPLGIIDDAIDEPDETFDLRLTSVSNVASPVDTTVSFTIVDNEELEVAFTTAESTVDESIGTVNITVSLSLVPAAPVTVDFAATVTSTATAGADYTLTPTQTLTFNTGVQTQTIQVAINDDAIFEPDETLVLALTNATNAIGGAPDEHTLTIIDNDTAPTITLGDITQLEGTGATPTTFIFTPTLSTASGVDAVFSYATSNGTAIAPGDYLTRTGTLTIPVGSTSVPLTVTVVADSLFEANETFTLTLTPVSGITATGSDLDAQATIQDDDTAPTIALGDITQVEGTAAAPTTFIFTATLSVASDVDATFTYATDDGTATAPADYTAVTAGGPLTIPAGSTSVPLTVTVVADSVYEDDETFTVTLTPVSGITAAGSDLDAQATIQDDDQPTVQFELASSSVDENGGTATITVTLNVPLFAGDTVTVPFSVTGGTAVNPDDYAVATASPLTFGPGDGTKAITVNIVNDTLDEDPETVELTLGTPTGATLGTQVTHTLTINDDDPPPFVGFTLGNSNVVEGGTATIEVSLSTASDREVTIDYAEISGGTATPGVDYQAVMSGTLTFAPGETTKTFTVTTLDDDLDELGETVFFQLSNPVNAILTASGHTLTIDDDDGPPEVTFDVPASSVDENAGTATIEVRLTLESSQAVTVDFLVTGGTAIPTDYTVATVSPLTFAPGEQSKTITVTINDNATYQADRTVVFDLVNAPTGGAVLGANTRHTLTIEDDDGPTVNFDPTTDTVNESDGTKAVTLTLDQPIRAGESATVDLIVSGTAQQDIDFSVPVSVTFNAGDTSKTFDITVIDDLLVEVDETVVLTLSVPAGSNLKLGENSTYTLTIVSDDIAVPPTISINDVTVNEADAPVDAVFTVTLSSAYTATVTVDYATADDTATAPDDYTAIPTTTLTFAPGELTRTISVSVLPDTLVERNQRFFVNLSNPTPAGVTIARAQGIGTIIDDDGPGFTEPELSISDATVNEADAPVDAVFTVTLSEASDSIVQVSYATLDGTAKAGLDYTSVTTTTLTFNPGETSKTIRVTVLPDNEPESDEQFFVTLFNPVNVSLLDNRAIGTIIDDDQDGSGNRAPVARDDTASVPSGGTITIDVLANDTDPDGDTLSVQEITQPAHGSASINRSGTGIIYTANAGYEGPDSFTYEVCDNGTPQRCATATVSITVGEVKANRVYLPMIMTTAGEEPPPPEKQPDLVVESFTLNPNKTSFAAGESVEVRVVVKNQGDAPTNRAFWVDFYINPQFAAGQTAPRVNQRWNDLCRTGAGINDPCYYGIAWVVNEVLDPGESITLTSATIDPNNRFSRWPGYFVNGTTTLFTQVDSWNPDVATGAVEERNEANNVQSITGLSVTGSNPPRLADLTEEIAPRPNP